MYCTYTHTHIHTICRCNKASYGRISGETWNDLVYKEGKIEMEREWERLSLVYTKGKEYRLKCDNFLKLNIILTEYSGAREMRWNTRKGGRQAAMMVWWKRRKEKKNIKLFHRQFDMLLLLLILMLLFFLLLANIYMYDLNGFSYDFFFLFCVCSLTCYFAISLGLLKNQEKKYCMMLVRTFALLKIYKYIFFCVSQWNLRF